LTDARAGVESPTVSTARDEQARTAGRGLFSIATAKVYFVVTSYGIQVALTRVLSEHEYGVFKPVTDFASIFNNVLIASTVLAVSKFVGDDPQAERAALRQGLAIQAVIGAMLAGGFFLAAPLIGTYAFRDETVVPLLRVASAIMFAYSLYAALVGSLNGRRLFAKQAGLDMTMATLRTVGILGGAALGLALGLGPLGAIGGFAAASTIILVIALFLVGTGERSKKPVPWKKWLGFMAPVWFYQLGLNGILLIDGMVLKGTLTGLATDAGMSASEAARVASEHAGIYSGARNFALVPYQLMLSMTFIVFPLISRATSAGNEKEARELLNSAMRVSLLVLIGLTAPIAGAADGVMRIAYPDTYLAGSVALAVLVVGMACFALFVISATALSGAGRPLIAAVIAAIGFVAVVAIDYALVSAIGLGSDAAVAAAIGTSIGMLFTVVVSGIFVYRRFRTFLPIASVLRGLFAGGCGAATAHFIPHDSIVGSFAALAGGFVVYLIALFVLREVSASDIASVRGMLARRRARRA
jgi:stage V sporulation protein B